jgi:catechol 2,3-dioxygenase-like lactoylglutathione lyase family enzyme
MSALTAGHVPTVGHVGLNVTDLARSQAFYRHVLLLEPLAESRGGEREWAFLGRDGEPVLTLWRQAGGAVDTTRPGLHHLSFRVDTPAEVRAIEARLRALGVTPLHDGVVAHREGGDSGGVFFVDPDGIRLEVFTSSGLAGLADAPHGDAPTCGFF